MLLECRTAMTVHKNSVMIDSDDDDDALQLHERLKQTSSKDEVYHDGESSSSSSSSEEEEALLSLTSEECDKEDGSSLSQQIIQEVWHQNLYAAFSQICQTVKDYPFVAMDTEFPGIVAKPQGNFTSMDEYKYQLVKCNVDMLKMIQLGVTLFDAAGNRPPGVCTWQFNFKFSLFEDLYAEDSIDLLVNSGLQFDRHRSHGVEPAEFAEMLLSSGLVLMDNVTWLTFHSAYDFGYLLGQLTSQPLPESETEFLDTLRVYFPNMYDIKYMMASTDNLNGGLQKVANELRVKRIGSQHQAGSDSLLTGQVFFQMYKEYFTDGLDDMRYNGFICGLGGASAYPTTPAALKKSANMITNLDVDEAAEMMEEELHLSLTTRD